MTSKPKSRRGSKQKAYIEWVMKILKLPYVKEYKFLEHRKFKFDFAIPDKMIAVEYEGVTSDKSRHTEIPGYTRDATKYNLAVIAGWRVLRYTALNVTEFEDDLKELLNASAS